MTPAVAGRPSTGGDRPVRIATRASPLARWQAAHVGSLLGRHELVEVSTSADRRAEVPIWELGGKGAFATEVQAAVLDGRADCAVHSAKDLPSTTPPGLVLAAVPERGDPRDALVGSTLAGLRPGARVATGSLRRRAQLADLRPDLTFAGLRGNMHTRLAKAAGHDAIVVAVAALQRLGLGDRVDEVLAASMVVPQAGQGALAVECRADDEAMGAALAAVEHAPSRRAVDAERAFLAELGGDCRLPAGAYAVVEGGDAGGGGGDALAVTVTGVLASADGHVVLRHRASGSDGVAVGAAVARHLLDRAPPELA